MSIYQRFSMPEKHEVDMNWKKDSEEAEKSVLDLRIVSKTHFSH